MVDLFHFCDDSDATCVLGCKIPEQKSMKPFCRRWTCYTNNFSLDLNNKNQTDSGSKFINTENLWTNLKANLNTKNVGIDF